MATITSNIDDLLMSGKTNAQPAAPEHQPEAEYDEAEYSEESPKAAGIDLQSDDDQEPSDNVETSEETPKNDGEQDDGGEQDEYGNAKEKPRTYTEDEVNERINKAVRERLARGQQTTQQQQQQTQASQEGFEYNPRSSEPWQQQLEGFVENTVSKMTQRQTQQQQAQKDQQIQAEFETKFHNGMSKFSDFVDVVGSQPISDAMTIATRAMSDPAAFLYAASKQHAPELQRIANLQDQYSQMVEMGKLEERMRKNKTATKAPRPLSRKQEDGSMPHSTKKQETIEDLIAQSDAKRRSRMVSRRR